MLNDSRIYQDTLKGLEPLISCTQISKAPNAIFDEHTLNVSVINAAIKDSSVGGCANAAKHARGNASPSDRWCASMLKSTHAGKLEEIFQEMVQNQIHIMKRNNKIPRKGITIAVDLHLIPRYDKKPGDDLTRSKYKRGTKYFERYMSVQCVNGRARITLGIIHLKMGDSVPKSLDVMIKDVLNMGVRINLALLDREFFSAQSIGHLQKRKVSFLIPCKNTGNVVSALRGYARRSSISLVPTNYWFFCKYFIASSTLFSDSINASIAVVFDTFPAFITMSIELLLGNNTGRSGAGSSYPSDVPLHLPPMLYIERDVKPTIVITTRHVTIPTKVILRIK